jgi:hypothetical protein
MSRDCDILIRYRNASRKIKIPKRLRWASHLASMEEDLSSFKIVTDTPREKRPLGRHRHRREDNIRVDLKEIGVNTRNWVDPSKDRVIEGPL